MRKCAVKTHQPLPVRLLELARAAKAANIGFNVDAEEIERLDLSLEMFAATQAGSSLVGWDGFSVVVRAINRVMADNLAPQAPLIAETGGINAMLVDSNIA